MIDRFNFYDVFGYFIPGCVLMLALSLPIAIAQGAWPSTDLASAGVAVVVAYLVGHFVQYVGKRALPSSKDGRFRSAVMLDAADTSLGGSLRGQVLATFKETLGLDMESGTDEKQDAVDDRREAAFYAAREQLVAADRARYVEQFQALYSMMRGNGVAAAIGVFYCVGWIAANSRLDKAALLVTGVGALAFLVTLVVPDAATGSRRERQLADQRTARWSGAALLLTAFGAGAVAGIELLDEGGRGFAMLGLFVAFMTLTIQSMRSYDFYAGEFAKAVYRGFVQIHKHAVPKKGD